MKIFWTAYYEFIKNIRDIRVLIALIAFPISIIILLGTAFDGKLSEDNKSQITVGYVILDDGDVGKGFLQLLESEEISKLLKASSYSSEADAADAAGKGRIDNYIVVPENTTKNLLNGTKAEIRLDGNKNIELVETVLNSYIQKSNAYSVALQLSKKLPEAQKETSSNFERIASANNKLPTAIDYYSVLTLLQVMAMGAILGINIVGRTQQSNIHIRLYSVPTSKWIVIYGKVLGSSMFLFISCIITVIFTKYVYHANWDGNLLLIALVLIVFSFLSIGIGIMAHAYMNNYISALGIAFLVILVTSSAGGAITPVITFQSLNVINPIYYAKVLIFGVLYNYPNEVMYKSAAGLLSIVVVLYSLSFLKLRRINYDNI